ncbi:spore coat protein SA [bacterium BMS3Abin03]|nr:spore coat protein SA [bacterium BMS3Abin03]
MSKNKKVLIAFLGNINYDSRCRNLFDTLAANGFEVEFVGFDWLTKDFTPVEGNITIHKLKKRRFSLLFYFSFIYHLKIHLLKSHASIIFAEDIYTLPFAVAIGKLKHAKIYYDSRELFGYLAGLKDRKFVQGFWRFIEKIFIRHADYIITTGKMDSEVLHEMYNISNTIVLRNLPRYYKPQKKVDLRTQLGIDAGEKILLYQGGILKGRGIKIILDALKELPGFTAVIVGGGEFENYYKKMTLDYDLVDRVFFAGKFEQNDLAKLTPSADIGVALIENISKSYYYALPNKLFEYIMAEIPVLVSNLPQMKQVIDEYEVGIAVNPNDKEEVKDALKKLATDKNLYNKFKLNCKTASEKLNWENEIQNLLSYL